MLNLEALTGFKQYKNIKSFDPPNCTQGSYCYSHLMGADRTAVFNWLQVIGLAIAAQQDFLTGDGVPLPLRGSLWPSGNSSRRTPGVL